MPHTVIGGPLPGSWRRNNFSCHALPGVRSKITR